MGGLAVGDVWLPHAPADLVAVAGSVGNVHREGSFTPVGRRAVTLPPGLTSAARPGKSSSTAEPAWPARAIHGPGRLACRRASPGLRASRPENPSRQRGLAGAPSVETGRGRKDNHTGAGGSGCVEGRTESSLGADAIPNPTPACSKTSEPAAAVNDAESIRARQGGPGDSAPPLGEGRRPLPERDPDNPKVARTGTQD